MINLISRGIFIKKNFFATHLICNELCTKGHAIPTVAFINKCWKEQDTDVSLIRHFVVEVTLICHQI